MSSWKIAALMALVGANADAFLCPGLLTKTDTATAVAMRRASDIFREFDDFFDDRPFFSNTGFDDFFDRPWMLGSPRPRLLQPTKDDEDSSLALKRSSPFYEITEDENQFKLAVDVPGVKPEDMNVQLEADGRVLRLHGERKVEEEGKKSVTKFEKSYMLSKNIDTDAITANMSDGVVVITAPKKEVEVKEVKQIPITTEKPLLAEQKTVEEEKVEAATPIEHKEEEKVTQEA